MARITPLLVIALLTVWQACCRPPSQPPTVAGADIKPADQAKAVNSKERILPSGRVELPGETVVSLIMFGYSVQANMIEGVPKWRGNNYFDIVAKAGTAQAARPVG